LIEGVSAGIGDVNWRIKSGGMVALYGVDPERGIWAELEFGGAVVTYDARSPAYDHERPIAGLLWFLCQHGHLAPNDIADAMAWLNGSRPGWPGRARPPRRLRWVLRVIRDLERAGR
jgi:hypothetical protein